MTVVRLQREPIDIDDVLRRARADGDGAVALFAGTVRDHHAGRRVLYLEYEAYPTMALRELERIAEATVAARSVSRVVIVHRLGRLEIGETSIAVAVAAPHRAEALEACRHVIDAVKLTVPIWKREHTEGGAVWIEGGAGP